MIQASAVVTRLMRLTESAAIPLQTSIDLSDRLLIARLSLDPSAMAAAWVKDARIC